MTSLQLHTPHQSSVVWPGLSWHRQSARWAHRAHARTYEPHPARHSTARSEKYSRPSQRTCAPPPPPPAMQMYQYFVSIVPTVYKDLADTVIVTNQYAITEHLRAVDHDKGNHGIPGAQALTPTPKAQANVCAESGCIHSRGAGHPQAFSSSSTLNRCWCASPRSRPTLRISLCVCAASLAALLSARASRPVSFRASVARLAVQSEERPFVQYITRSTRPENARAGPRRRPDR